MALRANRRLATRVVAHTAVRGASPLATNDMVPSKVTRKETCGTAWINAVVKNGEIRDRYIYVISGCSNEITLP